LSQTLKLWNKKKRFGIFGLIIGLFSIFIGIVIILFINLYPMTEILGQGLTLAQMDSLCGNVVVSALSRGACSTVHTQVYGGWKISVILIISGLVKAIFGKKNAIIEMLKT
jgi:hypothetical protein